MNVNTANTSNIVNESDQRIDQIIWELDWKTAEEAGNFLEWEKLDVLTLNNIKKKLAEAENYEMAQVAKNMVESMWWEEVVNQENEISNEKFQKNLNMEKEENRSTQDAQAAELLKQLSSDTESPESSETNNVSQLVDLFKTQQSEIADLQRQLLEAKKQGTDTSAILSQLRLGGTITNEVSSQLSTNDLQKLKTSPVFLRFKVKLEKPVFKKVEGRTALMFPSISVKLPKFRTKLRSRYRLNKTIKKINKYKNDSEWFMKYFLSKRQLLGWWPVWQSFTAMNMNIMKLFGLWLTKDVFEKEFFYQKETFITNLKNNITNQTDAENTTILKIENALDYHYKTYMVKKYGSYDKNYNSYEYQNRFKLNNQDDVAMAA